MIRPLALVAALVITLGTVAEVRAQTPPAAAPAAPADGRLTFEVGGGTLTRQPVAIAAIRPAEGRPDADDLGATFGAVLAADLEFSGIFEPLDPRSFVERPGEGGITAATIDFGKWAAVGALTLVKGVYKRTGDKVAFDVRIFDVGKGALVKGEKLEGPAADVRRLAHVFANRVVSAVTAGRMRGIFTTKIAAVKRAGPKNKEIWIMDYDGFNARKVVSNGALNLLPTWDRDGRNLYYTSYLRGKPDLYRVDVQSGQSVVISARSGLNTTGAPSPDGRNVALTLSIDDNSEIYLLDPAGQSPRRLTDNTWIDTDPTWSPDGGRIAFVSDQSGGPQLYIMEPATRMTRRLTYAGNYNVSPSWAPADELVAFSARDEFNHFDIFTVSTAADTFGDIKRLTQNEGKNNENPSFSPDGRFVAFASDRRGKYGVYVMTIDGTSQKPITPPDADYTAPAWSPLFGD